RYIEKGSYEIDNNNIENAVRPLALGRKNYLFAGTHHTINPYTWLKDILNRLLEYKITKINELLPDNWKNIEK
ncbi:MAG: IS66 family transposase, partial [Polaribacter sp.]